MTQRAATKPDTPALVRAASGTKLPLIGQTLLDRNLLSAEDLHAALAQQRATGRRLGEVLVEMGAVSPLDLTAALAERMGHEFCDLGQVSIAWDVAALLPEEHARRYSALPISQHAGCVVIAMARPDDVFALDDLRVLLEVPVRTVMVEPAQLLAVMDRVYNHTEIFDSVEDATNDLGPEQVAITDVEDGPIVRLLNALLEQAISERASDIHVEPLPEMVRIRLRTDGVLHESSEIPRQLLAPLVSRIKVLSGIDITHRRVPQDGRFSTTSGGVSLDVRVETIPTSLGEAVVLRLLQQARGPLGLAELGMDEGTAERFVRAFSAPQGCVIVTGPTGSGKTSTLYATLLQLNTVERNIVSVEDPVEYQLAGIKQMQVNRRAGLTFASALRSVLRADPDVLMVGEIRDGETARIAAEASVTGHLVLSTLHTNDAAAAALRLIDMGVEPYIVASAITCVVGQRLVRRLCEECSEPDNVGEVLLRRIGCHGATETSRIRRAVGCSRCNGTGYRGRTALYEVMPVDEGLARLVLDGSSAQELERRATETGMRTLRRLAIDHILAGDLSIEEMLRVIAV